MDTCIWYVMYTGVLDEALCKMMCFLMKCQPHVLCWNVWFEQLMCVCAFLSLVLIC